jgi:hypothetical protein
MFRGVVQYHLAPRRKIGGDLRVRGLAAACPYSQQFALMFHVAVA